MSSVTVITKKQNTLLLRGIVPDFLSPRKGLDICSFECYIGRSISRLGLVHNPQNVLEVL